MAGHSKPPGSYQIPMRSKREQEEWDRLHGTAPIAVTITDVTPEPAAPLALPAPKETPDA